MKFPSPNTTLFRKNVRKALTNRQENPTFAQTMMVDQRGQLLGIQHYRKKHDAIKRQGIRCPISFEPMTRDTVVLAHSASNNPRQVHAFTRNALQRHLDGGYQDCPICRQHIAIGDGLTTLVTNTTSIPFRGPIDRHAPIVAFVPDRELEAWLWRGGNAGAGD